MKQYLTRKGYDESTIERVMRRLVELNMLDDQEFAHYWVEQRETFKPRSRRALQHELFKLGVERRIVEEAVNRVDETAAAYRAATKKMNIWDDYSHDDFYAKMIPYLQRRGFNYATANSVTGDIWQELHKSSENY
jgi:regulatory protein